MHAAFAQAKIPTDSPQPPLGGVYGTPPGVRSGQLLGLRQNSSRAAPAVNPIGRWRGHGAGVRDHGVPGPVRPRSVPGSLARGRRAAAVRGRDRREAGTQARCGEVVETARWAEDRYREPRVVGRVRMSAPGRAEGVPSRTGVADMWNCETCMHLGCRLATLKMLKLQRQLTASASNTQPGAAPFNCLSSAPCCGPGS
jgi:hypothetical protein